MRLSNENEIQSECVSDNIMKRIESVGMTEIFKLLGCDEKYTNGQASDFERFDEWERILPLVAGHRAEKKYFDILSELGLPPVENCDYSRQRSIARWRQANSLGSAGLFEERREVFDCAFTPPSLSRSLPSRFFDIENNVSKIINECGSLKELSMELSALIEADESKEVSLLIKYFGDVYLRPDPYLADRVFKKKTSDEKCNISDELVMYSQLLIELMITHKKDKNMSVFVETDGNIQAACELIRYLGRRHLFEGDAVISVTSNTDMGQLSALTSDVYPSIFVRPCIDVSEDKNGENVLASIFEVYPIGAFLFRNSRDLPYALTEEISR